MESGRTKTKLGGYTHFDADCRIKGKIVGSIKQYTKWIVPIQTVNGKYVQTSAVQEGLPYNRQMYEFEMLFSDIVQHFPFPLYICDLKGTMVLANRAFKDFVKTTDQDINYNDYNVLNNPCAERWGLKDFILCAYDGETSHAVDVKIPYEEIVEMFGGDKNLTSESLFVNITVFPILDKNSEVIYTVTVLETSRYYQDRDEIVKGMQYIENNWKDKFNASELSDIVYLSRYHYSRLFKQHTGMTPFQYYQNVKVLKIKEKLRCTDLSIADAFLECGVDYNGNYGKTFKRIVGLTPSEYRNEEK